MNYGNKEKMFLNKRELCYVILLVFISFFGTVKVNAEDSQADFVAYYSEEVGEAVKEMVSESEDEVFVFFAEKQDIYNKMVKEVGFDNLGGAYYDEQGRLHILKKLSDVKKEDSVEFAFNQIVKQTKAKNERTEELDEWILLDNCKYSYNELMEYKNTVCHSSCYSAEGVFAVGIDDSINKINIHTIKGTDVSILSTLVPEDAMNIIFYGEEGAKAEFEDLESYTAYCGSGIINESQGSKMATLSCSVGWDLSTSQPKYGYLTAGHFASQVNDLICLQIEGGQIPLGRVVKTINNQTIDAALISRENDPNFPITSTSSTKYGTAYKFYGGVPAVGNPVTSYGYTSGKISGEVKESSYSNILVNIEDMVLTSMNCEKGDSGAPVITPITTEELSLSGIVKGRVLLFLQDLGTVYTKFNNITNEWDVGALR